jgi:hypothetical protein
VFASNRFGSTSQTINVQVDTLAPVFSVNMSPLTTDLPTHLLTGFVENGARLTIAVNPPSAASQVTEVAEAWSHVVSLLEGENVIVFTATDDAGNTTSESITITRLPPPLPSINVSPGSIRHGEPSEVTLTIDNPEGVGSAVYITILYDVGDDGFSADDISVRKFYLFDGVSSNDPNVPGDEDGLVNGRLTTTLNYQYIYDVQNAPGSYVLRANMSGDFQEVSFNISTTDHIQTIHGYVLDPSNTPVVGARVQLLDKWGHSYGYAYADVSGHYLFDVATAGEYYLLPSSSTHVYEKAEIACKTLAAGQNLNVDLKMVPGGSTVAAGLIRDSISDEIVTSGNYVRAENDQYIAEAYDLSHLIDTSDNDFKYEINLPDGAYELYVDTFGSRGGYAQGYLGETGPLAQFPSAPPDLLLDKFSSIACGTVFDQAMMGVAGLVLTARPESGTGQFATAVTDADGAYCIGLGEGSPWKISLNDMASQAVGYVGNSVGGITASAGPYRGNDLTVRLIDAWVSGTVLEDGLTVVAGVPVELTNALTGAVIRGETAADGTYRLGAFAGDWNVRILPEGLGFSSVDSALVHIAENQATTQNFEVTQYLEPPFVDVTVQSPTDQSSQRLSGNRSAGADVTVTVDTVASVGAVVTPTPTTWECLITNLEEGVNTVSVSASNGVALYQAPVALIDYQPYQQVNTIVITDATYDTRKTTLTVNATSDYPDAALEVNYAGITAPMEFGRVFKEQYRWSFVDTNVATNPLTLTVFGPEGSTDSAVAEK